MEAFFSRAHNDAHGRGIPLTTRDRYVPLDCHRLEGTFKRQDRKGPPISLFFFSRKILAAIAIHREPQFQLLPVWAPRHEDH